MSAELHDLPLGCKMSLRDQDGRREVRIDVPPVVAGAIRMLARVEKMSLRDCARQVLIDAGPELPPEIIEPVAAALAEGVERSSTCHKNDN